MDEKTRKETVEKYGFEYLKDLYSNIKKKRIKILNPYLRVLNELLNWYEDYNTVEKTL